MNPEALIQGRRSRPERKRESLDRIATGPALSVALAYPGYEDPEDVAKTRAFLTGSAMVHAAGFIPAFTQPNIVIGLPVRHDPVSKLPVTMRNRCQRFQHSFNYVTALV